MANETAADSIILGAAGAVAVAGFLNPAPGLDMVILLGAWASMLAALAPVCGARFDRATFWTATKQILYSLGLYILGYSIFLGITKWTGIFTFPAAIANAALDFGFTLVVGTMYREAWLEGREPRSDEIEDALKKMFDRIRHKLDKATRKRMKEKYDQLRARGTSQSDALTDILADFFGVDK